METNTNQTNGKTATPVSAAAWQNINSDTTQNINLYLVSKSQLKQTGYSYRIWYRNLCFLKLLLIFLIHDRVKYQGVSELAALQWIIQLVNALPWITKWAREKKVLVERGSGY